MNASDPGDRSTRVEREILEILERADSSQTPVDNFQAAVRRRRATARAHVAQSKRPDWTSLLKAPDIARIGGALLLAIFAAFIADTSRLAAIVLALVSAILFFSIWASARPSEISDAPRWRGQRLEDDDPPFALGHRPPSWRGPKRPSR